MLNIADLASRLDFTSLNVFNLMFLILDLLVAAKLAIPGM